MQFKNWCFTDFELLDLEAIYKSNEDINYIGFGLETCPKTGKKHHQGWVQFKNKKRITSIKKLFSNKTHFEVCRGSEEANKKYCSKENYKFYGSFSKQGGRTDLHTIYNVLKDNGGDIEAIIAAYPAEYCAYRGGLKDMAALIQKNNSKGWREVTVEVYFGATGTGKTRKAYAECDYMIHAYNINWWDDYNGESSILIDEFKDDDIDITKLLSLLDGYKLRLPIKGGFKYANWTKVIITSNIHPDEWYLFANLEHKRALMRRLNAVKEFTARQECAEVAPRGNTNPWGHERIPDDDDGELY